MNEIRWKIDRLQRLALKRPPGYLESLRKCAAFVEGEYYVFDKDADCYRNFSCKPQIPSQPVRAQPSPRPAGWGWAAVAESWELASRFVASAVSRGLVATALDSGGEAAMPAVRSLRILSCHGDDKQAPCTARSYDPSGKFHFCNECGCGPRETARLDSLGSHAQKPLFKEEDYIKLDYPRLECPRRMPGFSNSVSDPT